MSFTTSVLKSHAAAAATFDYKLNEPVARFNKKDGALASPQPYGRSKVFNNAAQLVNTFPAAEVVSAQVATPFKNGVVSLRADPGPITPGHTSLFRHTLETRADALFSSLPAPRTPLTVGELFNQLGVKTIRGVEQSNDGAVRALLLDEHQAYIDPAQRTSKDLEAMYAHFAVRPVALETLDRRVADLPREDLPTETIGSLLKKLGATNLYEAQMHFLDAERMGKAGTDSDLKSVEANLPAVQKAVASLIKDFDFVASAFPDSPIANTFTKQLNSGLQRRDEAVRQMKFFRDFLATPKAERLAFLKKEFTPANYGWFEDRSRNAAAYPLENPIARESAYEFVVRNLPQRHASAFENHYNDFQNRN